jgi:FG-GAP-like repeat
VLCFLILLLGFPFASEISAQLSSFPRVLPRPTTANTVPLEATPSKYGRFLGWKFAARSGQDVSRWRRGIPQHSATSVGELSTPRADLQALSATTPFTNAGFDFRAGLPTGFIPTAIAQGDFNGDGHMDVAISNGGDNTLYVLLGKGDGTFQVPEVLYTQGQSPVWITAADLRNSGHLDLVVADGDSDTVEVFLGNGDGTFQQGIQLSLPQTPTFVLEGDFNNDGNADIAVGFVVDPGATAPQFEILLGNGFGGFSGTLIPPPITNPNDSPEPTGWIASGDLNNDGFVDLVTTITGAEAISYLNQSGTSFLQGSPFTPMDNGPMVVGLGDMDEDGCVDAVELGTYGYVTIAKGTCDGNFTQGPPIGLVGDLEPAIDVVDVNGDGHLDVVGSAVFYGFETVGEGAQAGYLVSVFKGDGKGNLAPVQLYRGGTSAYSLVVTDLTGDGKPEIVTANSFENTASVFLNDGSGNYDGPQGEAIGYTSGVINAPIPNSPMETADFNGDGKPDLVLVELGELAEDPSQLTVMLNDGTGKFLPAVQSPITAGANVPYPEFIPGNFRNATHADVVYLTKFSSSNVVAFFPGDGDGTFAAPTTLATLPYPLKLVAGDFNNDGKLDFVVVGTDSNPNGPPLNWEFDVFLGHGDGTFTELPSQKFPIENQGSPEQLFAGDFNHDGKLDLLIGNNDNGGETVNGDDLIEVLGNGDGTFEAPVTLFPHFGAVAVADVNHDGYLDLIQERDPDENVTNSNLDTDDLFIPAAVTIYLGAANGTFERQPSYDLPGYVIPTFDPALVGDFNGDGNVDIAVRYYPDETVADEARLRILQGQGDGTFVATNHTYQLQALSNPFVGADFNGDGATDLAELTGYTSSFHTIDAAPAPSLDIAFDSTPIVGTAGTATVTLDQPAASSQTVSISASDPAVALPTSVSFSAGQQTQTFSFTLGPGFDNTHVLALYATLGAQTAIAYAARPNPNVVTGVTATLYQYSYPLSPSGFSTTAGEGAQLILQLASEGGYTGTFSSFQCTGLPAGASCAFSPDSAAVLPGKTTSVALTLATSASTPEGTYSVQVVSTDGSVEAAAPLTLGIGDFSISISPTLIVTGPSGNALPAITATSTNGLGGVITLACGGLPANVHCGQAGNTLMPGGSTSLAVDPSNVTAGDYPFQVTGTLNNDSHTITATLRVGDFTASLDKTTATLSSGQSAVFNVTLTSVNHYSNTISISCQPPVGSVTCVASAAQVSLTDDGTSQVQLTITAPSSAVVYTGSSQWNLFLVFLAGISLLLVRRRARFVTAVAVMIFIAIACGGGSSGTGGIQPPTTPQPPSPSTVSVSVLASANSTPTDNNNTKSPGPIVITLN